MTYQPEDPLRKAEMMAVDEEMQEEGPHRVKARPLQLPDHRGAAHVRYQQWQDGISKHNLTTCGGQA